jgi:hypothetical protein
MTKKLMIVCLLVVFVAGLGGCTRSDGQALQPKKESSDASKVYDQLPDSSPRLK